MKKLKKKALRKNIRQEILQSLGRFISIFSLIALGVFAYVGLNVTGADMRATSAEYINTYNRADIVVQSTFGLDEKELEEVLKQINIDGSEFENIRIVGLMGMATFTDNQEQIKREFLHLKSIFDINSKQKTENCQLKTAN